MINEITISPEAMSDFEVFLAIRSNIGSDKGWVLSENKKLWFQELQRWLSKREISPVKAKSIKNRSIEWLKNKDGHYSVYPNGRRELDKKGFKNWLERTQAQHNDFPFSLVIGDIKNNEYCKDEDIINYIDKSLTVTVSKQVVRKSGEIFNALKNHLSIVKEITIIDPYLPLVNSAFLSEFSNQLDTLRNLKKLTVFTSIHSKFTKETLLHCYPHLIKISLNFYSMPDKFIHDRYLFNDAGAIKAGHGFESGVEKNSPSDKVNLSLIGYQEFIEIRKNFTEPSNNELFKLVYSNVVG